MSLRIQQLNADTTFLLTFSPPFALERYEDTYPGDYTILIDPWLTGQSSILHPAFQVSHHTSEPAITTLRELKKDKQPDLIIISQDKPDHCHKETLCFLPKNTDIDLLATPAAAKKIRSWKHFDEERVHVMQPYSSKDPDSMVRIPLPGYSLNSNDGEITIANIPTKHDVTKLHNAIAITYQPPSSIFTSDSCGDKDGDESSFNPPDRSLNVAHSSPQQPRTASSAARPAFLDPLQKTISVPKSTFSEQSSQSSRADSGIARVASNTSNAEKVLSIVYTPHGVSSRVLTQYVDNHLKPLNALPVSALFHSINTEENPKLMGGVVAAGAPGGVALAKSLGVKHWIGAHDELKDNRGMATLWIKSRQYDVSEVRKMLEEAGESETKVHKLAVGKELRIPPVKKSRGSGKLGGDKYRMNVESNVLAMPEPKQRAVSSQPKESTNPGLQGVPMDVQTNALAMPQPMKRPIDSPKRIPLARWQIDNKDFALKTLRMFGI